MTISEVNRICDFVREIEKMGPKLHKIAPVESLPFDTHFRTFGFFKYFIINATPQWDGDVWISYDYVRGRHLLMISREVCWYDFVMRKHGGFIPEEASRIICCIEQMGYTCYDARKLKFIKAGVAK